MAAPAWKANGVAVGSAAAMTVNAPSGHAIGDFLLLTVNTGAQTPATPAGWTFPSLNGYNGATGAGGTADAVGLFVYYKFATTTTESALVSDSGDHQVGVITSFTGVSTTTPLDLLGSNPLGFYDYISSASLNMSFNGIGLSGPDRHIVAVVSSGQESTYSAWSCGSTTGFNKRGSGLTTAGADGAIACFSGVSTSSTSTAGGNVTQSILAKAFTLLFALKADQAEVLAVPIQWVMPVAATGVAYSWTIQTTGPAPTSCSITAGALPTGITISNAGVISGTCNTPGTYNFTVQVTDGVTPTSFAARIKVRTPVLADKVVVSRYAGTDAAITVNIGQCNLSAGGLVFIFDDLGTLAAASPTSWIAMSANGTTVAHTEYAPTPPAYATTGVTFANGTITLPLAMSKAGRTYYVLAIPKQSGICDVVSWAGTGAAKSNVISIGASAAAAFTIPSASQAVAGFHAGLGYSKSWMPQGYQQITSAITNASSTNLTVAATQSVLDRTYYGAVIADMAEVIASGIYFGNESVSGPAIETSGSSAKSLFIAGNDNIPVDGSRIWTRARAPNLSFASGIKARYTSGGTVDAEGSWPIADTGSPDITGLQVTTTDQYLNASGGLYGTLVFVEDPPSAVSIGSLNVTLAAATLSSAGKVSLSGALARTLGAATSVSAGTVKVVGSLSATLGAATSVSAGTVKVAGSASNTLAAATLVAVGTAGSSVVFAELAATLGAATGSSAGTVRIAGTTSRTLGAATSSSAGTVPVVGAVSRTLSAATGTSAGTVRIAGSASNTLATATVASTGTAPIQGQLARTLADATVVSTTSVGFIAYGSLAATLADATASSSGTVRVVGSAASTLEAASLSSAGIAPATGAISQTLGPATGTATAQVVSTGTLSVVLAAATGTSAGIAVVQAVVSITLADATATGQGFVVVEGSASITLMDAVLSSGATLEDAKAGTLDVVLADASIAATGTAPALGTLDADTGNASMAALGQVIVAAALSATLDDVSFGIEGTAITYSDGVLAQLLANASLLASGIVVASPRRPRPAPTGMDRLTTAAVQAEQADTPILYVLQADTPTQQVVQADTPVQQAIQADTEPVGALRPRTAVID